MPFIVMFRIWCVFQTYKIVKLPKLKQNLGVIIKFHFVVSYHMKTLIKKNTNLVSTITVTAFPPTPMQTMRGTSTLWIQNLVDSRNWTEGSSLTSSIIKTAINEKNPVTETHTSHYHFLLSCSFVYSLKASTQQH